MQQPPSTYQSSSSASNDQHGDLEPPVNRPPDRVHITFVVVFSILILAVAYLASRFNELVWVVTAITLITGIGQWLLPNFKFRTVRLQGTKNFFAREGFTILLTILGLLMVLNLTVALIVYNPLTFIGRLAHISRMPTLVPSGSSVHSTVTPSGIGSDGIGVYLYKGESIGISDGRYPLDTKDDRKGLEYKRGASEQLRAGNVGKAESLWWTEHEQDTNDAEPLIYLEDQRVLASGQPHITFVVGVLLSTINFDGLSRDYLQAAYIAQWEYNHQPNPPGGVLVRLLLAKSGSDPNQSTAIAQQVVSAAQGDPTIVGVMGWPTSETSQDTVRILASAHIPMVAPGAVSDQLTNFSPYFFRIGPPNKIIAQLLAHYLEASLKPQRVVLFEDPTESYSQSLAQAFTNQYAADGYGDRIVLTQMFTTRGSSADLTRSVQEALHRYTPDVIVFTSSYVGDMTAVLSAIPTTTQFAHLKVVMGTAAYAVIESDKSFTGYDRLLFSTAAFPDEWSFFKEAQPPSFFQDYTQTFDPHNNHPGGYSYSRPNALVMLGYDAMQILFYGSQLALQGGKTHTFSPDELRMALTQIHGSQAFQGITGQISFGPDRDPTNKVIFVLRVDNHLHLQIARYQGCFFRNCQPR